MRVHYVKTVLTRRTAQRDTQWMQSQPRGPTRPLGYHPISIWNSLLDSHRTADVQIRLRSNLPNQWNVCRQRWSQPASHSLAVCAKWLVIDRNARYTRCLRESPRKR